MSHAATCGCPLRKAGVPKNEVVFVKERDDNGVPTGRLIRMSAALYSKITALAEKITDEELRHE